jgi:hypothetical protein
MAGPRLAIVHQGVEQEIDKADLDAFFAANPAEKRNVKVLGEVRADASHARGTNPVNVNTGRPDHSYPAGRPAPQPQGPLLYENGGLTPTFNAIDADERIAKGAERAFSIPEAAVLGAFNTATANAGSRISPDFRRYSETVERDRPVASGVGAFGGAALVGRLLPGGAPAKIPEANWGAIAGQAGKMTAGQSGFSALSAANRADPGNRWKAATEAALTTAALSAPINAVAAPFTLKTPAGAAATIENTPELGLRNPTSWLNPESYKNSAAVARISSLRTSPTEAADVAAQYAKGSLNPSQGLVNFGRELNSARNNGVPVFRRDDAGQMVAKAAAEKTASGNVVGGFEAAAEKAGNLPDMGRALSRVRGAGTKGLGDNPIGAEGRVGTFNSAVDAVENRIAPRLPGSPGRVEAVSTKLDWPAPPQLGIPFPERQLVAGPEASVLHPRAEPVAYSRSVDAAPSGVPTKGQRPLPERLLPGTSRPAADSGWGPLFPYNDPAPVPLSQSVAYQGSLSAPGARLPDFGKPTPVHTDIRFVPETPPSPPLGRSQFDAAKNAVRWFREDANRRGGFIAEGADPERALVGRELGRGSAIINDEIEGQVGKTVGSEGLKGYQSAKDRYGLMSRVEEMANPHRSAVSAPFSLSSVLEGGALAQTAASMGAGPGTVITMRQAGRLLGRQRGVNPARADRLSRLAEGVETPTFGAHPEGAQVSPFYRAAGTAVRGAQRVPGAAGNATAVAAGEDVARAADDPSYQPQPPFDMRAWIARKWLDRFYNSPAQE